MRLIQTASETRINAGESVTPNAPGRGAPVGGSETLSTADSGPRNTTPSIHRARARKRIESAIVCATYPAREARANEPGAPRTPRQTMSARPRANATDSGARRTLFGTAQNIANTTSDGGCWTLHEKSR